MMRILGRTLPAMMALAGTLNLDPAALPAAEPTPAQAVSGPYCKIQVVDRQTGRGVPLVELRTVNQLRYVTDSNGIVAFYEPGLMDREVFFFVSSHGYEIRKDGFGFAGTRLQTTTGGSAVIRVDRINIAERLYRNTGQGIYRDSVLTGQPVPLREPVLNGQVLGQDSVFSCIYHGRLFWMWGDTARPSYPLGHFRMAGALSDLPGQGGLDPAVGVNLEYYVDEHGFSRPLCLMEEPGMIWLDGLVRVNDPEGNERMVARFARLKNMSTILGRGLMAFNDQNESFEPIYRGESPLLACMNFGHAARVKVQGRDYYYFATVFPLAVSLRMPAEWDSVIDPNRYEVLTGLAPQRSDGSATPQPVWAAKQTPYRWVRFADLIGEQAANQASVVEGLEREKRQILYVDIQSGKAVTPHGGTIYYNAYRRKWIAIFNQQGGKSSYLGELWYAEADSPVGPWAYARQIATHEKYSFYNPAHHPYFDQDGGRTIFFEGTYSFTFSGTEDIATPRYDYNQIMYRLRLDDPRLTLPAAIYQVTDGQNSCAYLPAGEVEKANRWDDIESVAFFAVEPQRAAANHIGIYAQMTAAVNGQTQALSCQRTAPDAEPLFYALPAADTAADTTTNTPEEPDCIVPLYEYRHAATGRRLYRTEAQWQEAGWVRQKEPLCRVWLNVSKRQVLDHAAKPVPAEQG
ncbi:MAG: hypothetical protein JW810_09330 [Sedimentisphaerales bacterium]|nr:hypothetical protein [Sedimentisphaerales bacterium]